MIKVNMRCWTLSHSEIFVLKSFTPLEFRLRKQFAGSSLKEICSSHTHQNDLSAWVSSLIGTYSKLTLKMGFVGFSGGPLVGIHLAMWGTPVWSLVPHAMEQIPHVSEQALCTATTEPACLEPVSTRREPSPWEAHTPHLESSLCWLQPEDACTAMKT